MSLYTIVADGLAGRLAHRSATAAVAEPQSIPLGVRLTGTSMRFLETGLAIIAIATALLIGLGH